MLTKAQLIADGCVPNQNMWIGDGWMFCRTCNRYSFHGAMSHQAEADCYEVCKVCDTYTGNLRLKGSPVTTAADILEAADAKRRIQGHDPKPVDLGTKPLYERVPSRVYVLLQSGTVLGALSVEQKALDEAYALMHQRGGTWAELIPNRVWKSDDWGFIEISAHDVR